MPVTLQIIGFSCVSGDDQFEMGSGADVSANLQQHNVIEFVGFLAPGLPQILELSRVGRVGQKTTAACRLRLFLYPEGRRQCHLWFSAAAAEIIE